MVLLIGLPMNENQKGILLGGIILIIGIILFSKADLINRAILSISTTQLIAGIIMIIGIVLAVIAGIKEVKGAR